ncbi:MAG: ferritin-like protein [Actinomycetota bacterium]|nr:ferritin-like protein [Actinomycetota bacterium]MDQ6945294.1 ferritin-like protein [Actinomycetota bacterium]
MLQYLDVAFSMKKDADATCTPAELEHVRRWYSTMFVVARQEMEHLSLVKGMLSALGAPPHFLRRTFGGGPYVSSYHASPSTGSTRPARPC